METVPMRKFIRNYKDYVGMNIIVTSYGKPVFVVSPPDDSEVKNLVERITTLEGVIERAIGGY
jgi:hypothetical protein